MKYFVEERKISDEVKSDGETTMYGQLDCLKYLVEEARAPLTTGETSLARYNGHTECENYLLEKGSPEPTDEQYATFAEGLRARESRH